MLGTPLMVGLPLDADGLMWLTILLIVPHESCGFAQVGGRIRIQWEINSRKDPPRRFSVYHQVLECHF